MAIIGDDPLDNLSFVPYQEFTESKANVGFVIGVIYISACLLATLVGPIIKNIQRRQQRAKEKTPEY